MPGAFENSRLMVMLPRAVTLETHRPNLYGKAVWRSEVLLLVTLSLSGATHARLQWRLRSGHCSSQTSSKATMVLKAKGTYPDQYKQSVYICTVIVTLI
jgi:hypothetical protein